MKLPKVFAHGSYIGVGGFNNHTRDFFRELSNFVPLKVRNFTVGKNWEGLKDEPHNKEEYITELDKQLLVTQSTYNSEGGLNQDPIYKKYSNEFSHNINLILSETNHYYFYEDYVGPKIGYNVWESTRQPEEFFNKWKKFDQLWVPSKWQAACTIAQGVCPCKVEVVPEGVDVNTFYPEKIKNPPLEYKDGRFKFVVFGRWEYRKSTKELIQSFLTEFSPDEPIDLVLSVENSHGSDGFNSTQERLKHYGLLDDRVKVKPFVSRKDYVDYLKMGHVFLSCARSEGWNLPLIEAMACGTPSIYSNCSGQLEFAQGKGHPVKIKDEVKAPNHPGNYYEPDFDDLMRVMRDVYQNYEVYKKQALEEAKIIHKDFNWGEVGKIASNKLSKFLESYVEPQDTNSIKVSYLGKPRVEINGNSPSSYLVEFINSETNEILHSGTIKNNMWIECNKEYFIPWIIKVNGKVIDKLNLEGENVYISLESKSIGDTLAWTPYAVKFAEKHKCKVIISTFHNKWFFNLKEYKNVQFTHPGASVKCKVHYKIGWFKNDEGNWDVPNLNPSIANQIPLQKTATEILGLEFKELSYGVNLGSLYPPIKQPYVVFGPQATAGCKEWVYEKWEELAKKFVEKGYKVITLTQGQYNIPHTTNISNQDFKNVASYLKHADYFVGLGSGLSWLNWALGKHTYMINGFVEEGHEFTSNMTKITNDLCIKCWNDPVHIFDPGDWNWCPVYKGTKMQHICQKSITADQVYKKIFG